MAFLSFFYLTKKAETPNKLCTTIEDREVQPIIKLEELELEEIQKFFCLKIVSIYGLSKCVFFSADILTRLSWKSTSFKFNTQICLKHVSALFYLSKIQYELLFKLVLECVYIVIYLDIVVNLQ